jgi:hypothetical protein
LNAATAGVCAPPRHGAAGGALERSRPGRATLLPASWGGACDAFKWVRHLIEIELNHAADNPDEELVLTGRNFRGSQLAVYDLASHNDTTLT